MMMRNFRPLRPHVIARTMSSQTTPTPTPRAKDWSATQYLKFNTQRTRPARDLLAQVPLTSPSVIVDLGCGPGNSTQLLADRFPTADITGIDSSPNMIDAARKAFTKASDNDSDESDNNGAKDESVGVRFHVADINTYLPEQPPDLLFSNAALHWIKPNKRIGVIRRLIESLPRGGVFAMQVPDNHDEPVHAAMRRVAQEAPWRETLSRGEDPAIGRFQTVSQLYEEMKPLCESVDVWRTVYNHPMGSHWDVVEWIKGTGMRPYLDPLGETERDGFLESYHELLRQEMPVMRDGGVMLPYPRLFMVAVR